MPGFVRAGEVLAERYRLEDLLAETGGGVFWRAHDSVLHRPVAVHIIRHDDPRADEVLAAARSLGPLNDRRLLRVLDAARTDRICYVVAEWGQGESLDLLLDRQGPLSPRRAAWLVSEVADTIAVAHDAGLAHGRLAPENVLIDHLGHVRIIGFAVEASLAGLPAGRTSGDLTDLTGLLYAALTGAWPGLSRSRVRRAPVEHGHVLRPRQVRAGIPRPLDALCDEVLNGAPPRGHRGPHDITTARGIADLLSEFVGEATGTPLGAMTPLSPTPSVVAPTMAVTPPTDEPNPPPVAPDLPTEAGMPVFHDDSDDVEWLRARSEPPAPAPPLEEVEAKPLFAPDPPEGEPVRRPRAGTAAAAAAEETFWPWEESGVSSQTGSSSGGWQVDTWGTDPGTGEHVPGRSWMRLAMIVALSALVLLASVAAYQLGRGNGDEPPPADTASDGDTTQSLSAFPISGATDFDPQGSPPKDEYPELVPLAIDGDDKTVWHTASYKQNFGPGGLKTGVGIVVDLGDTGIVREVAVTVRGETSLATYVTETPPERVDQLTAVGEGSGDGEVTITLDEAVGGRYVTIWLTSLPRDGSDFRGQVAEIQVRG